MAGRRYPVAPSRGDQFTNRVVVGAGRKLPKYVFVLSLENRSFDHLFGRSKITGKDPATGKRRGVNGVLDASGNFDTSYANTFAGKTYPVAAGAPFIMPSDPKHEFEHILCQTAGSQACIDLMKALRACPDAFAKDIPPSFYEMLAPPPQQSAPTATGNAPKRPPPDNSGFIYSYVRSYTENFREKGSNLPQDAAQCPDPQGVMRSFDSAAELPNLHKLASNYVLCDNFFSSLPGPTAPNRFFMMSGSAAGNDASPTSGQMMKWTEFSHLPVATNAFKEVADHGLQFQVFGDDAFPMAAVMQGVHDHNTYSLRGPDFPNDIGQRPLTAWLKGKDPYPYALTWIEPDYDVASSLMRHPMFSMGNSMHPCSDVRRADQLVGEVYALLASNPAVWNNCVLFITWDEHGGFYDHVPSPEATPPDGVRGTTWQFGFDRFGARVPCLAISPLIERNLVDGRPYDHASILRTVVELHNAGAFTDGKPPKNPMTLWNDRVKNAVSMLPLFTDSPAADPRAEPAKVHARSGGDSPSTLDGHLPDEFSDAPISGNTPTFLFAAMRLHKAVDPTFDMQATARQIKTDRDAAEYFIRAERAICDSRAVPVA